MGEQTNATLAERLSDLWDAEGASWEIHYEPAWYSNTATFRLDLEWATDSWNPHRADWITYTWQFYAATADEAIADGVAFCEALEALKQCEECDGKGAWNGVTCEPCNGTGLASQSVKAEK